MVGFASLHRSPHVIPSCAVSYERHQNRNAGSVVYGEASFASDGAEGSNRPSTHLGLDLVG